MGKRNILFKIFDLMFIVIFGIILFSVIFNNSFNGSCNLVILIFISILIGSSFLLLYKIINRVKLKHLKVYKFAIFGIIFLFQIIFAIFFRVTAKWDYAVILNAASNLDNTFPLSSDINYFSMYTNNIPIVMLLRIFFLILNFIGIKKFEIFAIIFNIIMIDLGIYINQKLVEKFIGVKESLISLIMLACMCPIYLYVPIVYTDTLSFLFPQLILYLYLKLVNAEQLNKKCLLYSILIGILTFIGLQIKFSIVIMFIAILIFQIFGGQINKSNLKMKLKNFSVILLTLLIIFIFNKLLYIKFINKNLDLDKKFPFSHWIMMGLKNNGNYSEEDVDYTKSFATYEEKKIATKEKIVERLKEHVKDRDFNFILNKLTFVWGDGNYYSSNKLSRFPNRRTVLHEYIIDGGQHQEIFKYITQSIQFCILFFSVVAAISNLKENNDINIICRVAMFGLVIFFLLWEARSRYIMNYIGIFIVASVFGIRYLNDIFKSKRKKELMIDGKKD